MTTKRVNRRSRHQRAVSNVFAMFNDSQIQGFKQVFNMIDQNRDGVIDQTDLQEIFRKAVTDEFLDDMVNECPGPINFTAFLTLFGQKLTGTDSEDVLLNAFQSFDRENAGKISEECFRQILASSGDRYTDNEVDELLLDVPMKNGFLNYVEFIRKMKHGNRD